MLKPKIINNRRIIQPISLLALDVIFFGTTNTTNVAAYIVFVGFILLIFSIYAVIYGILFLLRYYGIQFRRKSHLAAYMTAIIGVLVALQSIGELSLKDVLVLLPLTIIGYVYISYAKVNGQKIS